MKTVITLIFALFMFSFTLESSNDLSKSGEKIWIFHNTGNGFIQIEIAIEALQQHLDHGDQLPCIPPAC